MNKINIKTIGGRILFSYEKENNTIKDTLERAVLEDVNLRDANLRGAYLRGTKDIPQSYINICSQQMLYIFTHLKHELPRLREKIIHGEIEGTQYEGTCCCLIGTLGNGNNECINKVVSCIPYYDKGLHNPAEQWFWQIRKGDTPDNSFFSKHVLKLIDSVIGDVKQW